MEDSREKDRAGCIIFEVASCNLSCVYAIFQSTLSFVCPCVFYTIQVYETTQDNRWRIASSLFILEWAKMSSNINFYRASSNSESNLYLAFGATNGARVSRTQRSTFRCKLARSRVDLGTGRKKKSTAILFPGSRFTISWKAVSRAEKSKRRQISEWRS